MEQHGKKTLLSAEEEQALAVRVQGGDIGARDAIIVANLRLVHKIAQRYKLRGIEYDELVCIGNIGLIRAAEKYLPNRGRFSTYATFWVRQSILSSISKSCGALPAHVFWKTQKSKRELQASRTSVDNLTDREIATMFNIETPKGVSDFRSAMAINLKSGGVSTELSASRDKDFRLAVDEADSRQIEMGRIVACLGTLDFKSRTMLEMRFGIDQEPCTLEVIGKKFDVSRERVRQVVTKAIRHIQIKLGV